MALTVTLPAAGGHVGPGFRVAFSGAAGPTAVDDILLAAVEFATFGLLTGSKLMAGATSGDLVLGNAGPATSPFTRHVTDVVAGDSVSIRLQRFNRSLGLIEQTVTTGFVWDPINGLWALSTLALESSGSIGVAAILAAVTRTYSTP